jgi:hypothetical protein
MQKSDLSFGNESLASYIYEQQKYELDEVGQISSEKGELKHFMVYSLVVSLGTVLFCITCKKCTLFTCPFSD